MRLSAPKLLVDIGDLKELTGQSQTDGVVRLGALTRHGELLRSDLVSKHLPLLVPGGSAYRPRRDPQPRHARRQPRLCRSGGGIAGMRRGARGDAGAGQPRGRARGEGRGFLQGTVRDRPAARRVDRRGQISGDARRERRSASPNCRAVTAISRWSGLPRSAAMQRDRIGTARLVYFGCVDRAKVARSVSAAVAGASVPLRGHVRVRAAPSARTSHPTTRPGCAPTPGCTWRRCSPAACSTPCRNEAA